MEPKKSIKANLENKRNLFLQLGLVIALGVVLMAFNLNNTVAPVKTFGVIPSETISDDLIPPITMEEPKLKILPPPMVVLTAIEIVDNNTLIEDDFDIQTSEAPASIIIDALPKFKPDEDDNANKDTIFTVVQEMPKFPGGEQALLIWLGKHLNYPSVASEIGLEGKVFVNFVVDKDGSIANARVTRGVDQSLNDEALRVVNAMPKWKPGLQRGKPVRVSYTVPINFKLQ